MRRFVALFVLVACYRPTGEVVSGTPRLICGSPELPCNLKDLRRAC